MALAKVLLACAISEASETSLACYIRDALVPHRPRFRTALTLCTLGLSLLIKLSTLSGSHLLLGLSSWAFECVVFALLWQVCAWLEGRVPRFGRIAADALFYPLFYLLLVVHLAQTYFFDQALERHFSLLDLAPSSLAYFAETVLPRKVAFAALAMIALLHGIAFVSQRRMTDASERFMPRLLLSALIASVGCAVLGRAPVSVFIDTYRDLRELGKQKLVHDDTTSPAAQSYRLLDRSPNAGKNALPKGPFAFDRVLVFIMETTWNDKQQREARELSPDTYINSAKAHAHSYTRYYTTNQDSRTSVLGLLGSRLVPLEAYTAESRDRYLFLEHESSLVDTFKQLGFETAFGASQGELELVVGDLPWQHTLMFDEAEIATAARTQLCFTPYEFEHSCEDKALLPKLFALLDRGKPTFFVQQMMWGHASEYNQASGKTNARYYSEYLDLVVTHLKERGMLERTLLVLTADHGFREKADQLNPAVYQVPLSFYAPGFSPRTHDGLYWHLDFKELLLRELTGTQSELKENPFLLIVGTTGNAFLTVFERDQMWLLKDRPFATYLVPTGHRALDGRVLPDQTEKLGGYLALFHGYRARFGPDFQP